MFSAMWMATLLASMGGAPLAQGNGVIDGKLLYPSCMGPPEDLVVCAERDNGERHCTQKFMLDAEGYSYRLLVPAGRYRVYANSESNAPGFRAYFSQAVRCGLDIECNDHTPVEVGVAAGTLISGVHPADWNPWESDTSQNGREEELAKWVQ